LISQSRGLGDVYKRQAIIATIDANTISPIMPRNIFQINGNRF
jgi:hypothetical protein